MSTFAVTTSRPPWCDQRSTWCLPLRPPRPSWRSMPGRSCRTGTRSSHRRPSPDGDLVVDGERMARDRHGAGVGVLQGGGPGTQRVTGETKKQSAQREIAERKRISIAKREKEDREKAARKE